MYYGKVKHSTVTKSRLKEEAAKLEEKKLKGITQVKLFQVGNPDVGILEEEINRFLKEKEDKINVKDVKLCTGSNNSPWTAMVIYEVK